MIDLLNGATVQGIILDEESCRLTILNNLNHVPFSKYRRWRIKKYMVKFVVPTTLPMFLNELIKR